MMSRHLTRIPARAYSSVPRAAVAVPRKIGAIRGGLLGFLVGVTTTGAASYYYLLDEFKTANNVVVADVALLQNSVSNLEKHVKELERK